MDRRRRWLRGRIRAVTEFELDERLRERGLDLITCKQQRVGRRGLNFLAKGIDTRDLTQMCIHLEQMDAAGVPLLQSLAEARDSIDSPRLQDVITEIHRDVNEGVPLSAAFAAHSEVFDSIFSSLIAAGEEAGSMTDSFRQLVKHLKWTESLNAKIKKATRYPLLLATAVVAAILFLMVFVVPQVVDLLESIGEELPLPTLALIAVSDVISRFWYLALGLPVVFYVIYRIARRLWEDFAFMTDNLALRVPVVGVMVKKISFARFAHIFAVTFQSGLPILTCIESAKRMVANRTLAQAMDVVKDRVQAGDPLSEAMQATGEFPPLVVHMVKVGEDSGSLEDTLWNVAEFYDRDVQEAVSEMISMIEPALIFVMGGIMAWVALAVFGPIYSNLGSLGM